MNSWKYWLQVASKYYGISSKELLKAGRSNLRAKSTFYWLLFKDGIDLYKTSVAIGKRRNTIAQFINTSVTKEPNRYRDKSAEEYLLSKSKN
jgi:hypothetical protein